MVHNWKLNFGDCSFRWDDYLGEGRFAQCSYNSNNFNNTKVADFWVDGQWSCHLLIHQDLPSQLANILATTVPQQQLLDKEYWKAISKGMFSCSLAWNEIWGKKPKYLLKALILHNHIPFKVSFLLWRVLRGKLHTNEKLTIFGIDPINSFFL